MIAINSSKKTKTNTITIAHAPKVAVSQDQNFFAAFSAPSAASSDFFEAFFAVSFPPFEAVFEPCFAAFFPDSFDADLPALLASSAPPVFLSCKERFPFPSLLLLPFSACWASPLLERFFVDWLVSKPSLPALSKVFPSTSFCLPPPSISAFCPVPSPALLGALPKSVFCSPPGALFSPGEEPLFSSVPISFSVVSVLFSEPFLFSLFESSFSSVLLSLLLESLPFPASSPAPAPESVSDSPSEPSCSDSSPSDLSFLLFGFFVAFTSFFRF